MARKKATDKQIKADEKQIYEVGRCGIKVYPIDKNGRFFIQVDNNNRISTFDKPLKQNEINNAIALTVIHFYNKIKEAENGKLKLPVDKGNSDK